MKLKLFVLATVIAIIVGFGVWYVYPSHFERADVDKLILKSIADVKDVLGEPMVVEIGHKRHYDRMVNGIPGRMSIGVGLLQADTDMINEHPERSTSMRWMSSRRVVDVVFDHRSKAIRIDLWEHRSFLERLKVLLTK